MKKSLINKLEKLRNDLQEIADKLDGIVQDEDMTDEECEAVESTAEYTNQAVDEIGAFLDNLETA